MSDQQVCLEVGPLYHMAHARQTGQDPKVAWNKVKRLAPEVFRNNVSADTVIRQSEKFEIHNSLLYKRVFDAVEGRSS